MTAVAMFAVLWPLGRDTRTPLRAGSDIAVYRDQLDEVARDRAAGLIGEAEAEAARVEVSRRLIAAADAAPAEAAPSGGEPSAAGRGPPHWSRCPLIAAALYLALGSPQLPGQPLASRDTVPLQDRPLDRLVAQVEEHLEKNPRMAAAGRWSARSTCASVVSKMP